MAIKSVLFILFVLKLFEIGYWNSKPTLMKQQEKPLRNHPDHVQELPSLAKAVYLADFGLQTSIRKGGSSAIASRHPHCILPAAFRPSIEGAAAVRNLSGRIPCIPSFVPVSWYLRILHLLLYYYFFCFDAIWWFSDMAKKGNFRLPKVSNKVLKLKKNSKVVKLGFWHWKINSMINSITELFWGLLELTKNF